MLHTTRRDANRLLTVIAALAVVIFAPVVPAQAHEWPWWRHGLTYPYAERDPSNPWAGPSTVKYRSVTREIQSYRPIEPLPWGDVNRGVTPTPKLPLKPEKE